jgi:hypothetical protein
MRKFVLAALSLTFLPTTGCDSPQRIARLEKDNTELKAQLEKQNAAASLGEQEKCSNAAKRFFNENYGRPDNDTIMINFHNHFNRKQSRCFVVVEWHYRKSGPHSDNWTNLIKIYDALENNEYADFAANHYIEGSPSYNDREEVITCKVAGAKCNSIDEFNKLSSPLMND